MWTNFEEDHLDYHGSMNKYFLAKANMFSLLGTGSLFVGKTVQEYAEKNNYKLPRQTEVVNKNTNISDFVKNNNFMSSFPQRENLALAYTFALSNGIKRTDFERAIESYEGQPHRLQKIDTMGMATFWNDSKSTNYHSLSYALRQASELFKSSNFKLIVCGDPKKENFRKISVSEPEEVFICGFHAKDIDKCLDHPRKIIMDSLEIRSFPTTSIDLINSLLKQLFFIN